ncbi:hypothetical protein B5P22_30920 [Pseudomonas tolaasii]|nr:hypothetical protein B5P22_30920 [Pseudomonas tolaasii]
MLVVKKASTSIGDLMSKRKTRKSNIRSIVVSEKRSPSPSTGKTSSPNSSPSLEEPKVECAETWMEEYFNYRRDTGMFT